MRYMLLIYYDEKVMQARDEEQQQQVFQEYLEYTSGAPAGRRDANR